MTAGGNGRARSPARPDGADRPHPSRLDPGRPDFDRIMDAHRAAVAAGAATYVDPSTGLTVMTGPSLVERGWCCDNGCRHCPYVGV